MDVETVIVGIVVLALVAVMYKYWPKDKGLDVNEDGKVDSADAKAAVEVVAAKVVEEVKVEAAKVVEEVKAVEVKVEEVVVAEVKKAKARVKKAADVNEDGKVGVADVVEVVKKGRRPKKSV